MAMRPDEIAARIDQTLLKPGGGLREAAKWIEANADLGFATLVVPPYAVALAAQRLAGTVTSVCSVAAFPFGYQMTETKAEEAARLVDLGCREVDMVANIGALLEHEWTFAQEDVRAVVQAVARTSGGEAAVKVIIETGYLSDEEIARAGVIAADTGAAFVKTCTGFGPRGVTVDDVLTLREAVNGRIAVKASGGVRDLAFAQVLIQAGAERIGTSSGISIVEGAEAALRGLEGLP